jgi:hypothetical protein
MISIPEMSLSGRRLRISCATFAVAFLVSALAGSEAAEPDELHTIESNAECSAVNPKHSEGVAETGKTHEYASPPSGTGPTLVDLGLYIIDISNIREIDNTVHVQGLIDLVWCDPRLAFDPDEAGLHEQEYLEQVAAKELDRIWWPDPDFENQVAPRRMENRILVVRSDGTVDYEELFVVDLKSPFDLRRFPFDRQTLQIRIESFVWTENVVRFLAETDKIGFSDGLQIPEWQIESVTPSIRSRKEVRDRAKFSEFILDIEVVRESAYYVWRLILPLVAMVFISWIVFWLTGPSVKGRLNIAFRGLLIVVAYQFVISGSLPRLPYMTVMDGFLTLSFFLMVLTILQCLIVTLHDQNERHAAAKRIDSISRWLFPVLYLGGILALAVSYGLVTVF